MRSYPCKQTFRRRITAGSIVCGAVVSVGMLTIWLAAYLTRLCRGTDGNHAVWIRASTQPKAGGFQAVEILYGIFTVPQMHKERGVHRSTWMRSPMLCDGPHQHGEKCAVAVYFVMGEIPNDMRPRIDQENGTYGDLLELPIPENMNNGKSFAWFRFSSTHFPTARFIGKGDMDTFVRVEALVAAISRIPPNTQGVYGGVLIDHIYCGYSTLCARGGWIYMQGGLYFMTQDLARWLGAPNNTIVEKNMEGAEDKHIGKSIHDSKLRVLYMVEPRSSAAWTHPVNITRFYELQLESIRE